MRRPALAALLCAIVWVTSCAKLALLPVTPLLSAALASRGGDDAAGREISELERRGDWKGLAQFAERRVQREPDSPGWWIVLGYAHLRSGDYGRASGSFGRAATLSPEDIDAWNMLGESQRLAGQPGQAVQTLLRAISIDPASPVTRHLLGESYRDDGRLERAKDAYREALRIEPRFAPALFGLGTVLLRTGPAEELQEIRQRLKSIDPGLDAELSRVNNRSR